MEKVYVLNIGIAPLDVIREMTLASARGEYKISPDDPKIWFTSLESLAQALSTPNQFLLEIIAQAKPESMTELAERSGRKLSNLSRTLKTMEKYGLVKLKREKGQVRPEVDYDKLKLNVTFRPDTRHFH